VLDLEHPSRKDALELPGFYVTRLAPDR
jgi:hypothetical protein